MYKNNKLTTYLTFISLILLFGIEGCSSARSTIELLSERHEIKRAVQKYFDAEIRRDFRSVYKCLAPSSSYRSTHTYKDYLMEAESSPVRVISYSITKIHDLRANQYQDKYPGIEKFVQVEVDVTLFYDDIKRRSMVNYDFTFIKEDGTWYKG